ncbi:MAG: hypothetical protein H0T64_12620 [Pyrinomonadaceae bacterium]|nr:hypothetical protein [Pyrinomonadaceae bacterium]
MKSSRTLARLLRIPERCRRDARLIGMLENWPDALTAELKRTPLKKVELRNGVKLRGPHTVDLAFLFQETWVREMYSLPGYEIRRGGIVIDIGANIGVFATYGGHTRPGSACSRL